MHQFPQEQAILWEQTAPKVAAFAPLAGESTADVVIVGGGMLGTRAALGLAQEGVDVALLEAHHIGFGASGRSGGQCNPIWRETPDQLREKYGASIAECLISETVTSADDLFADIEKLSIDCSPVQKGWSQLAHCRKAADGLKQLGQAWGREGAQIEPIEGDAIERLTGSPGYKFGLLHKSGGHVQPYSMTCGFAMAASDAGARLYGDSRVTSIERHGSKWVVETKNGRITTDKVVVVTNAYSNGIIHGLKATILPMVSIIMATEPLNAAQQKQVLPAGTTLSDTRRSIRYARLAQDNRLVFGCIGSGDQVASMGGLGRLSQGLSETFPALKAAKIDYHWSGRIAMTTDLMPRLYEPEPGLTMALGFSGRGVVNTSVMARTLVRRLSGAAAHELPFPVTNGIQGIPFHRLLSLVLPLLAPTLSGRDKLDLWGGN